MDRHIVNETRKLVLVIKDDEMIYELFKSILESKSYDSDTT
jgi:DNA-binding response OmpR family regulator